MSITCFSDRTLRYRAEIAGNTDDVRAALALRHRVFAEEMGARLHSRTPGLDDEELDDYCDHLVVRDTRSGRIVACSRLLTDTKAARYSRFYSESEFDLGRVLALPGRFLEIGRTCVDPGERGGLVMSSLWGGLAEYVGRGGFNYLMGCASIPPGPGGFAVDALYRNIPSHRFGPADLAVVSKRPVPYWRRCDRDESGVPPLLQAYLRLGCWLWGDPYWDEDFDCMDVFVLLDLARLQQRYEKRFMTLRSDAGAAGELGRLSGVPRSRGVI